MELMILSVSVSNHVKDSYLVKYGVRITVFKGFQGFQQIAVMFVILLKYQKI